jgi:hypothetical protein
LAQSDKHDSPASGSGTSFATSSAEITNTLLSPSLASAAAAARFSLASSVRDGQAVTQKTLVAFVDAAIGAKSLSHLEIRISWASSHASKSDAVAPTTFAVGDPVKKMILAVSRR